MIASCPNIVIMSAFISRVFKYRVRHTYSKLGEYAAIKASLATHFLESLEYLLFLAISFAPYRRPC
jgi:hypothetical protein